MNILKKLNLKYKWAKYIWQIVIFWTLVIFVSSFWNITNIYKTTIHDANLQAIVAFDKDVQYRRWNAQHGGVYVPVSNYGKLNPYLKGLVKRDIITQDGDMLTMINPAYMTRQIHESELSDIGVKGHITSLNLVRPENAADEWETAALQAFDDGLKEIYTIEMIDSIKYFRFMKPLITEKSCLKCHEKQGYKIRDVRGGISISIPIESMLQKTYANMRNHGLIESLIWIIGLVGIVFGYKTVQKVEEELIESNLTKQLLLDVITHDLKNSAGAIKGLAECGLENDPNIEILDEIKNTTDSLLNVLNNVTTLSKVTIGDIIEKEKLNLVEIINVIIKENLLQLEYEEMTLDMKLNGELLVNANPIIDEVFRNYIGNAIKYAKNGKKIVIDAIMEEGFVVVNVKDFGETIEKKDRESIFLRSVQLGKAKGQGLGLSIVKRIAIAHNAEVGVKPNKPKGNTFYIKIPVS